jgi:predicted AAA+ superfamily ATPase
MYNRRLHDELQQTLDASPAVALLGPRQVGKTTLALDVAANRPSLYLDLESERDRAKLADAELYLADHRDKLVILDEIHRAPGLFGVLRGQIDQARRVGKRSGQYLLLGSASLDLLKQSGETLAGRISYLELSPLTLPETGADSGDALWVRGGFPDSLQASTDARSLRWRQDFIRTYLERDVPQFGPRIATQTLRLLWTMLAHQQGGMLNTAQLARNLGIDVKTVNSYLHLLTDLLLLRRLLPWHDNLGKRLVKTPRIFVRDSGLVHALLGLGDKEAVLGHPVAGASWEGHCIENLLACAPRSVEGYFYRTGGGAEIDLLLRWPAGELWAIEIKRSLNPKPARGFYAACEDLQPARRWVVYPGQEAYPIGDDIRAVPLDTLCAELLGSGPKPGR